MSLLPASRLVAPTHCTRKLATGSPAPHVANLCLHRNGAECELGSCPLRSMHGFRMRVERVGMAGMGRMTFKTKCHIECDILSKNMSTSHSSSRSKRKAAHRRVRDIRCTLRCFVLHLVTIRASLRFRGQSSGYQPQSQSVAPDYWMEFRQTTIPVHREMKCFTSALLYRHVWRDCNSPAKVHRGVIVAWIVHLPLSTTSV
jgi:hypothetical protein